MEPLILKTEWVVTCENCGHPAHCDRVLKQKVIGGDSFPITIECCKNCRCKVCDEA